MKGDWKVIPKNYKVTLYISKKSKTINETKTIIRKLEDI